MDLNETAAVCVVHDLLVAGDEGRIVLACRGDEQAVQRIRQGRAGNGPRIEGDGGRELDDSYAGQLR